MLWSGSMVNFAIFDKSGKFSHITSYSEICWLEKHYFGIWSVLAIDI